jgi:hypothetical protein
MPDARTVLATAQDEAFSLRSSAKTPHLIPKEGLMNIHIQAVRSIAHIAALARLRAAVTAVAVSIAALTSATASATYTVNIGSFQTFGGGTPDTGNGVCVENDCSENGVEQCVEEQACASPTSGQTGSDPQQWQIDQYGQIQFYKDGSPTGNCLDLYDGSITDDLGQIDIATCSSGNTTGSPNHSQIWQYTSGESVNGYTTYGIIQLYYDTDYCLDVHDGQYTAGTYLDVYKCNGTAAQTFLPLYFSSVIYATTASGLSLDLNGSFDYIINTYDASETQFFTFLPWSGWSGAHGLVQQQQCVPWSEGSCGGYGLTLGWNETSGSTLYQQQNDASYYYGWNIVSYTNYDGELMSQGDSESECLDVYGAGTTAGTAVDYDTTCNGTDAQTWQIELVGLP